MLVRINRYINFIRTCKGKGAVNVTVKETVNIPKGVDNGINLRISKKGHFQTGGPPGDLMINIKVKPDPYFKRDGSDIYTDLHITVSQVIIFHFVIKNKRQF
jgi:molecular chaperone DnaJ